MLCIFLLLAIAWEPWISSHQIFWWVARTPFCAARHDRGFSLGCCIHHLRFGPSNHLTITSIRLSWIKGKSHYFQAVATILTKVPFDQLINIMYIVTQPDHKHFWWIISHNWNTELLEDDLMDPILGVASSIACKLVGSLWLLNLNFYHCLPQ